MVPESIRSRVPKPVRHKILPRYRIINGVVVDYLDWVLGRKGRFTPPRHLVQAAGIGGSSAAEFKELGQKQLRYCVELASLNPRETVLEVGCGIGRLAAALTKYLNQTGRYEGFDIGAVGIGWCQSRITPEYPNFRFRLVDVYNRDYNPKGRYEPSDYKFPYDSESFDLVFAYSVFTHMIPEDFEHYLSEISRVMKTNGRSAISFLLINSESARLIDSGQSVIDLRYQMGPSRVFDKNLPESTIGFEEEYVRKIYSRYGLDIVEPIRFGYWPGREGLLEAQDIIIARKTRRVRIGTPSSLS